MRRAGEPSPIPPRVRQTIAILATAAAVSVGAGCATPSPTMSDYQTKTRTTARAMAGVIGVARTGAREWAAHRLTEAYADTMITECEDDAGSIINTYDSRQPPTEAAIALRQQMDQPLQAASSALSDLRIALRRGDRQSVAKAVSDLAKPLKALNGFTEVGL